MSREIDCRRADAAFFQSALDNGEFSTSSPDACRALLNKTQAWIAAYEQGQQDADADLLRACENVISFVDQQAEMNTYEGLTTYTPYEQVILEYLQPIVAKAKGQQP